MEATRLYLVRHGQVVNHHELRYNGHFDVDITDEGVEQMERLADYLTGLHIHAVYSSDLTRAFRGATIICRTLGLRPEKVHALREVHLGRWEGLTREEAAEKFPEEAWFSFRDLATERIKGGESLTDLRARVMPALEKILDRHRHGSVLVVAHGGTNRVILCDALNLDIRDFFRIEQDYGCLNVIDYFDDGMKVVKMLNAGPNQDMKRTILY